MSDKERGVTSRSNTLLTAEEAIILNAAIDKEMARRNDYDSLTGFSGERYQFSIVPEKGQALLEEHGKKTIDRLLEIKDHEKLKFVKKGEEISNAFNNSLITYVNELSKETMTGETSSCRSACTGLCVGTCGGSCSGCSGLCTGCRTEAY